jgi:hypothetical protein
MRMTMLRFILLLSTASAWLAPSIRVRSGSIGASKSLAPASTATRTLFSRLAMSSNEGVQVVSLKDLTDHEADGSLMAESIVKWLDAEWMPQTVHVEMAESAKNSYISARTEGETEIMSIMMVIAEDLNKNWEKYDADAFVNAWDVSNYVSDYLTDRTGSEGCECSNKIY